jgi:DNA-binding Lrp family transcriptional regulator
MTYAPNSDIFKAIAGELEGGIPLVTHPFGEMASRIGVSEDSALDTAREMLRSGFMRRFGPFFDFRKLGYEGYLFGVSTGRGPGAEITERICSAPYVTHVYERENALNLWFTVLSKKGGAPEDICRRLKGAGLRFVALRGVEMIKLRPAFVRRGQGVSRPALSDGAVLRNRSADMTRVMRAARLLEGISRRPFGEAARLSGMGETELLEGLRFLSSRGIIRRIGASFNHYRAGWKSNSLCAFDLSAANENEIAGIAAAAVSELRWASHCYIRRVYDRELSREWPYNLYAMVHAVSDEELAFKEDRLREAFGGAPFISLKTARELKKAYFKI